MEWLCAWTVVHYLLLCWKLLLVRNVFYSAQQICLMTMECVSRSAPPLLLIWIPKSVNLQQVSANIIEMKGSTKFVLALVLQLRKDLVISAFYSVLLEPTHRMLPVCVVVIPWSSTIIQMNVYSICQNASIIPWKAGLLSVCNNAQHFRKIGNAFLNVHIPTMLQMI